MQNMINARTEVWIKYYGSKRRDEYPTWGSLGDLTKVVTLERAFRDEWYLDCWRAVGRGEGRGNK